MRAAPAALEATRGTQRRSPLSARCCRACPAKFQTALNTHGSGRRAGCAHGRCPLKYEDLSSSLAHSKQDSPKAANAIVSTILVPRPSPGFSSNGSQPGPCKLTLFLQMLK